MMGYYSANLSYLNIRSKYLSAYRAYPPGVTSAVYIIIIK